MRAQSSPTDDIWLCQYTARCGTRAKDIKWFATVFTLFRAQNRLPKLIVNLVLSFCALQNKTLCFVLYYRILWRVTSFTLLYRSYHKTMDMPWYIPRDRRCGFNSPNNMFCDAVEMRYTDCWISVQPKLEHARQTELSWFRLRTTVSLHLEHGLEVELQPFSLPFILIAFEGSQYEPCFSTLLLRLFVGRQWTIARIFDHNDCHWLRCGLVSWYFIPFTWCAEQLVSDRFAAIRGDDTADMAVSERSMDVYIQLHGLSQQNLKTQLFCATK